MAAGGPRRTPAEAVEAVEQAISIIRQVWSAGPDAKERGSVRLDGMHYRVVGAHRGPRPAHDVGIWLGAYKPQMLRVIGRLADGWLPTSMYLEPDTLAECNAVIDEAAESAGRSPVEVRRLYNIAGRFDGAGREFLRGPAEV